MSENLIAESSITIDVPVAKVWDALTNPLLIKEYLFGTHVKSDWQVGHPITYSGMWNGKAYEDKGIIIQCIPNKILETTYWSSMGGLEDTPENYKKVTYRLLGQDNQTTLTISQDHCADEAERTQSINNWSTVLTTLKTVVEK